MSKVLSVPAALIMSSLLVGQSATAEDKRVVDRPTLQADGSVRLPARTIEMPGSFSPEARKAFLRSEEHTSELQSLMRISYAVFCLKKKTKSIYTHIAKLAIVHHTDYT